MNEAITSLGREGAANRSHCFFTLSGKTLKIGFQSINLKGQNIGNN